MARFISTAVVALAAALAAYSSPLSTSSSSPVPSTRTSLGLALAPLVPPIHPHGSINNSYIVVLKPDVTPQLMDNHFNFLASVKGADAQFHGVDAGLRHVYDGHVKGYAGVFSEETIGKVREMPEVDWVEQDQVVMAYDLKTQNSAPWGLARISHRPKLRFGTFTKYEYDTEGGDGVDVYVIDTGINTNHTEFAGRASWGYTVPQNDVDQDGNGHGSHCAGTIASNAYGVAKKANVIAVKVLGSNGSGSMSDVVGGVDWASKAAQLKAQQADAEFKATGKTKHKGSVANMSLGGGKSPALDRAVNNAVESGMHFAVAAGNDNRDACDYSPAAAEKAVTVGASTISDERAYFSNHGPCVDVFGPGLNIKSTYIGSNRAVATLSGTSMASPHVAGLLAYYLSLYPSERFQPILNKTDSFIPDELQTQRPFSSLYVIAHRALPSFISQFLPSPALLDAVTAPAAGAAPVPERPVITPAQMKAALLALASEGLLTDLPAKTVNKLIFNNATAPGSFVF